MQEKLQIIVRGINSLGEPVCEMQFRNVYGVGDFDKPFKDACWVPGVVRVVFDIAIPPGFAPERRSSIPRVEGEGEMGGHSGSPASPLPGAAPRKG